jgi:hypothetical protein
MNMKCDTVLKSAETISELLENWVLDLDGERPPFRSATDQGRVPIAVHKKGITVAVRQFICSVVSWNDMLALGSCAQHTLSKMLQPAADVSHDSC